MIEHGRLFEGSKSMRVSSTKIFPEVKALCPLKDDKSVDFPAPDCPITDVKPFGTVIFTAN